MNQSHSTGRCDWHMQLAHAPGICSRHVRPAYARTDGRDELTKNLPYVGDESCAGNARETDGNHPELGRRSRSAERQSGRLMAGVVLPCPRPSGDGYKSCPCKGRLGIRSLNESSR